MINHIFETIIFNKHSQIKEKNVLPQLISRCVRIFVLQQTNNFFLKKKFKYIFFFLEMCPTPHVCTFNIEVWFGFLIFLL